jgi:hypothetical protein
MPMQYGYRTKTGMLRQIMRNMVQAHRPEYRIIFYRQEPWRELLLLIPRIVQIP